MKINRFSATFLILLFSCFFMQAFAQADSSKTKPGLPDNKSLTITYNLSINGIKKTGIEEVYNGGNKTIFISKNKMRVRLVSLMRIQSIYFELNADTSRNKVTVVKESGKDKYTSKISWADWQSSNSKYNDLKYDFSKDTLTVFNYLCQKANIKLKDGREITAYYTDKFYSPLLKQADPAFASIPGIVLQYQYKKKGKSITYTVAEISLNNISKSIFMIPSKNFEEKKLSNNSQEIPAVL